MSMNRRKIMVSDNDRGWYTMLYQMLYKSADFKELSGSLRCIGILDLEDEFTQIESLVVRELPEISAQYAKGISTGAFKFVKGNRFPLTNTELLKATKDMSSKDKDNFFKNVLHNEPAMPYMCVNSFISDIESLIITEHTNNDIKESIKSRLPKHYKERLLNYFDPEYIFSPLYEERRIYSNLVNHVYSNKILTIASEIVLENRVIVIDATTVNVKVLAGCSWWELIHKICKL